MESKNVWKMKKNIILILISLTLTGCYQDIDLNKYKGENGENLLVLNSIINPDSTVTAVASKTFFYSDPPTEREYVTDLDIELSINGEEKGLMKFNPENNHYESFYKPDEKDIVELKTIYRKKGIECIDTVPKKIKIESVKVYRQGPMAIYTTKDYLITYEIEFTDLVNENNYYFLQYAESGRGVSGNLSFGVRDFTYEYVFQQLARKIGAIIPAWEPYSPEGLPFSDYGIEGKTHTLVVKEIIQGSMGAMFPLSGYTHMLRKISLYSISESYYNYLVSRLYNESYDSDLHGGLIDLGFTEPLKTYSNINGGTGIFASYCVDEKDIDVIETTGPFN